MGDAGSFRKKSSPGDLTNKVEHERMLRRFAEEERRAHTDSLLYGGARRSSEKTED